MSRHDPRQFIEDLRNHLAAPDRTIGFLFGAGTSSSINVAPPPRPGEKLAFTPLIPGTAGLTKRCEEAISELGPPFDAAWNMLVEPSGPQEDPANIEGILTDVRTKLDAIGDGESLIGLDGSQLRHLEGLICDSIADAVDPSDQAIPDHTPHDDFASWLRNSRRTIPVEVFTTNYDILIERALERARVPLYDAFVGMHRPFFYPESLDDDRELPPATWVRLWKLHGSVNWATEEHEGGVRVVRGREEGDRAVILPSHRKYDESRKQPYVAYMDRLHKVLNSEHSLLITCGYSFGDEHINGILFGALDARPTANVVALCYDPLDEKGQLLAAARRRTNLSVAGPARAVISGEPAEWQLTQPVDGRTAGFMDIAFDSNASPDDEGSPASSGDDLSGCFRLGDFNWLCRFLTSLDRIRK